MSSGGPVPSTCYSIFRDVYPIQMLQQGVHLLLFHNEMLTQNLVHRSEPAPRYEKAEARHLYNILCRSSCPSLYVCYFSPYTVNLPADVQALDCNDWPITEVHNIRLDCSLLSTYTSAMITNICNNYVRASPK